MNASFITLNTLEATEDGTITINVNNISSVKRLNYNDELQTIVLMVGGERFGVHETVAEIIDLATSASKKQTVQVMN